MDVFVAVQVLQYVFDFMKIDLEVFVKKKIDCASLIAVIWSKMKKSI